ncbi:hypothetical protein PS928_06296 [Pseudomonas fluorescens]|uniref:SGNH hydrolase-type esterase domain-containing protein n=2 Tax=Pseudomonas fluorescens TaxID=294 RepID=A0A5E7VTE8_PSEFL|nr:hypothetical protein PS928_06296 [Pseudomonas fluorescens]
MKDAFNMSTAGKQATADTIAPIDVAVCFYGTNDFGGNTPLGAFTDSSSAATFYGATRKFFETLLGWKPTIKIVMLTPLKRTSTGANTAGFTLLQYVDAVIQVAADYSAPVLDLHRKSGLNALNMMTWTSDGLHPTAAGQTALIAKPTMGFFDGIG